VARRAAIINRERNESPNILVLEAGDALIKDAPAAIATHGATSIEAMNLMGYDAMALGMLDISNLSLAELGARMNEAHFPILSANAYSAETGDLIANPYTIVSYGDLNVGILGLTDPGTTDEVYVGDPLQAVERWLPELAEQAEIIILLSHAGMETDILVTHSVPGIDLIIGGGARGLMEPTTVDENVPIYVADYAYSGAAGLRVGIAHLGFTEDGSLRDQVWQRVQLGPQIDDDPQMSEWLTGLASAY